MSNALVMIGGLACALLIGQCVLLWLLRSRQTTEAGAQQRHTELVHALAGTGSAFKEAVVEFQRVVITLENVALIQQISDRVDAGCARLEACHTKLASQVNTTGAVVERLHELVGAWAEGGSRAEQYYRELGKVLEDTLRHDREQRQQLLVWVQTMALTTRGASDDVVGSK